MIYNIPSKQRMYIISSNIMDETNPKVICKTVQTCDSSVGILRFIKHLDKFVRFINQNIRVQC